MFKKVALSMFFIVTLNCVSGQPYSSADKLHKDILKNYNKAVPPRWNLSDSVDVFMYIRYVEVVGVDVVQETITLSLWLTLLWKDELLVWNTTDYGGIRIIKLSSQEVWTPDIQVQNLKHNSEMYIPDVYFMNVHSYGGIRYDVDFQITTPCSANIRKFPFDEHECEVELVSDHYDKNEVNITGLSTEGITMIGGQWEVMWIDWSLNEFAIEDESLLVVHMSVKRQALLYVLNLLLPILIITTINPFVFLVKADSGEKVSISVTLFLSLTIFISLLSGMLPQTSSSISVVSLYVCVQFALSGLYVVFCIVIQRINQMKRHNSFTSRFMKKRDNKVHENSAVSGGDSGAGNVDEVEWCVKELSYRLDRVCFILFISLHLLLTLVSALYVLAL